MILCMAGLLGALMSLIGKVQEQGAELIGRQDQLEDLVTERTVELSREIATRKEHGVALEKSEEWFRNFTEMAADRY